MGDKERHQSVEAMVTKVISGETYWAPSLCRIEPVSEPCSMVIFGASGDLTKRKLLPSLFNLYCNNLIPREFFVLGTGRTAMKDEAFRNIIARAMDLEAMKKSRQERWKRFSKRLFYQSVAYDEVEDYRLVAQRLCDIDTKTASGKNRIFYLATPPTIYKTIVTNLGISGLSKEEEGWARIVIEKPFGRDLLTARDLNEHLHRYFKERQIFRIDHYLGKETVQDILMFRFANTIFEPVWNRQYIDHVQITASETIGVEQRAGYYEEAGVIRDMFQNHMMQLLALTTMEPPVIFESNAVRDEKVKVFKSIRAFPLDRLKDFIVLGQYLNGKIEGRDVPGYQDETGVAKESRTPTFAAMRLFVDNWRWQGVPFYLRSGKRMAKRFTEIVVQFKGVPHMMFHHVMGDEICPNMIILRIQPNAGIQLVFQVKLPGSRVCLRTVMMDFAYGDFYTGKTVDAYERVLLDCILGDHMLFVREDGVESTWSILTPALKVIESRRGKGYPVHGYEAGSLGPLDSDNLLERYGHRWKAILKGDVILYS